MNKPRRYVYKLTFPNGKVYFGSTYSVKTRWANDGAHYKTQPVYEAIEKYGWENIKKEVVLFLSNNDSLIREVEMALIRDNKDMIYNCQTNPNWISEHKTPKGRKTANYKHVWTIDGETQTAKAWCDIYGKRLVVVLDRMKHHGMTPKEALTYPSVPATMHKKSLEYWNSLGLTPGTDTTSYVTPRNKWPSWIPQH